MYNYLTIMLCVISGALGLHAGFPKAISTTLPVPGMISQSDIGRLGSLLKLELYPDSEDSNKYYYVPPARILSFEEGAAGMVFMGNSADNAAQARKMLDSLEITSPEHFEDHAGVRIKREFLNDEINYLTELKISTREEVSELKNRIEYLEEKLLEAQLDDNLNSMKKIQDFIAKKENTIEILSEKLEVQKNLVQIKKNNLKDYINELVISDMLFQFNPILTRVAVAGKAIDHTKFENPQDLVIEIYDTLEEIKNYYGGFMAVQVYWGFTQQEMDDLTYMKNNYWPQLKVTLLSMEELEFESLAEVANDNAKSVSTVAFKKIKGSGGYSGATINFDFTLDGATALMQSLGPINLPVGISANIKEKLEPFHARLKCNMESGFSIKGRADIRDGLVIYDNDMTNDISTNITDDAACHLDLISGDPASANFAALTNLQEELTKNHLRRVQLSEKEKQTYYGSIAADLQSNRRNSYYDDSWFEYLSYVPFQDYVVQAISRATDFHWHTSIYDVENLHRTTFNREIRVDGHQTIRKKLNTRLCIYFNAYKNAYDRCTETQQSDAINIISARKLAEESPACAGLDSTVECGRARQEHAPELRHREILSSADNNLPANF